jgi:hypothetical protein
MGIYLDYLGRDLMNGNEMGSIWVYFNLSAQQAFIWGPHGFLDVQ